MAKLLRAHLQHMARERLEDARTLLDARRFTAAYHLAGYVVECALKACIARQTEQVEFPDKSKVNASWSHKLDQLVQTAGLAANLSVKSGADAEFGANWSVVKDWNEDSRYVAWSERQAQDLFTAITEPTHGVLPWIEGHW
jgi:hypothetical protein